MDKEDLVQDAISQIEDLTGESIDDLGLDECDVEDMLFEEMEE